MPKITHQLSTTAKRRLRVRGKLFGTAERPRVSVFRSNKGTYVQAINDSAGLTLAASSDLATLRKGAKVTKMARAEQVASELASKLVKQGIKAAVLDRGHYRYHGRVKAVAEALRAAGVEV